MIVDILDMSKTKENAKSRSMYDVADLLKTDTRLEEKVKSRQKEEERYRSMTIHQYKTNYKEAYANDAAVKTSVQLPKLPKLSLPNFNFLEKPGRKES